MAAVHNVPSFVGVSCCSARWARTQQHPPQQDFLRNECRWMELVVVSRLGASAVHPYKASKDTENPLAMWRVTPCYVMAQWSARLFLDPGDSSITKSCGRSDTSSYHYSWGKPCRPMSNVNVESINSEIYLLKLFISRAFFPQWGAQGGWQHNINK